MSKHFYPACVMCTIAVLGLSACGDDDQRLTADGGGGEGTDSDGGGDDDADGGAMSGGCGEAGGGRASFSEQVIAEDVKHGQGIDLADVDGDGDLDVFVTFSQTNAVRLYLNDCGSWRAVAITPDETLVGTAVVAADYDGDGDVDVAVASVLRGDSEHPPGVYWYENPGDPTGTWTEHAVAAITGARTLAAGDLNHDDRPDLVLGTVDGNAGLVAVVNSGAGFMEPQPVDAALRGITSVEVRDLDGDRNAEVIAVARGTGRIALYQNTSPAGPSATTITFDPYTIADVGEGFGSSLANLDSDPELELVASTSEGIVVYDNAGYDGNGVPQTPWRAVSVTAAFAGQEDVFIDTGDLDGDGAADVAVASRDDNQLEVFLQSGAQFTSKNVATGYEGANFVRVGDVDGDGDADLVTSTYRSGGVLDRIAWWSNGR